MSLGRRLNRPPSFLRALAGRVPGLISLPVTVSIVTHRPFLRTLLVAIIN